MTFKESSTCSRRPLTFSHRFNEGEERMYVLCMYVVRNWQVLESGMDVFAHNVETVGAPGS